MTPTTHTLKRWTKPTLDVVRMSDAQLGGTTNSVDGVISVFPAQLNTFS